MPLAITKPQYGTGGISVATDGGGVVNGASSTIVVTTLTATDLVGSGAGVTGVVHDTLVDAKGDILTATADDTPARLAVGTDQYPLVPDASTATGLAYRKASKLDGIDREQDPASHGYKAWTFSPTRGQISDLAAVDHRCIANKIWVPKSITVTGIAFLMGSQLLVGETALEENAVGLFSSAGTLLSKSADQAAAWKAGSTWTVRTADLAAPQAITGGEDVFVWAAILVNATTPMKYAAYSSYGAFLNAGLTSSTYAALNKSTVTEMPATAGWLIDTPGSEGRIVWMALY